MCFVPIHLTLTLTKKQKHWESFVSKYEIAFTGITLQKCEIHPATAETFNKQVLGPVSIPRKTWKNNIKKRWTPTRTQGFRTERIPKFREADSRGHGMNRRSAL